MIVTFVSADIIEMSQDLSNVVTETNKQILKIMKPALYFVSQLQMLKNASSNISIIIFDKMKKSIGPTACQ